MPDRIPFANATAAQFGGRSLPIAAVKEYQILLAPYDVRYGDFAGALVNTVTRSGTNQLQGSVFVHARNDALARTDSSSLPYDRTQFGFSLGGPIVRGRLHFFVAPELQRLAAQANGPYLGQRATSPQGSVPVSAADVARVENVLRTHGLVAGSGGPVENENPQTNVFARLDLALASLRSRIALWTSYSRSRSESFARANDTFPLSTLQFTPRNNVLLTSLQLHTTLRRGGGHNELLISHNMRSTDWLTAVRQPVVQVAVPGTNGASVTVSAGTHPAAQAAVGRVWTVTASDNLTLMLGAAHVLTLGAAAERFRITTGDGAGSFGTWSFSSVDALERGAAERYELREQGRIVPIGETQLGVYAGDQWRPGDRLSLTMGVRADVLWIDDRAPYNPVVDSIFGRRTDAMPRRRLHLSPRLGFSWDPFGTGRNRIRGGAGIFTGRPPVGWLHVALTRYGAGVGELRCGPTGQGPPPAFEPDYRRQPTTCANGLGFANALRDVDLVDPDLRMAQMLRASLAYDRQLASDVTVTAEALVTRNISDFNFVNLNLVEPRAVDQHGRVLYGELRPTGVALPDQRAPQFAEVIDLTSTSRNHSYQLTARLESGLRAASRPRHRTHTPARATCRRRCGPASVASSTGRRARCRAGTTIRIPESR